MLRSTLRSIAIAAGLAAVAGCERAADGAMSYDAMPRLTLTPQAEICAGRDDAPCQFVRADIVAAGPDGRVVVGDGWGELREFDRDGQYVRTVGGKGAGPGEYQRLIAAGYDSAGRLTVFDQAGFRLQRFDTAGQVLEATTAHMLPRLIDIGMVRGRLAFFRLPGAAAIGDTVEANAVLLDPGTGDTTALPGVPAPAIATGDGSMFPLNPLFTASVNWRWALSPDGALHLADGERLRIVRRDADGVPPRVLVDMAVEPRPVTAEELEAEAARLVAAGRPANTAMAATLRRMLDEAVAKAAKEHPLVSRLVILDDGTLLAREGARPSADSVRWNAFAADGTPLGHLVLPVGARVAAGRLARLLVVTPGELDVPRIVWYEVR